MDPSQKQVVGDLSKETDNITPESVDGIRLGVVREGYDGTVLMSLFTWEDWEMPVFHERLKESYAILRDYFASQQ